MRLRFPSAHVKSHFAYQSLGGHRINAIHLNEVDPRYSHQLVTERKLRHVSNVFDFLL